jgi:hypothetical protein
MRVVAIESENYVCDAVFPLSPQIGSPEDEQE